MRLVLAVIAVVLSGASPAWAAGASPAWTARQAEDAVLSSRINGRVVHDVECVGIGQRRSGPRFHRLRCLVFQGAAPRGWYWLITVTGSQSFSARYLHD